MSDPLSIAAGVVGLITACTQISSLLFKLTKECRYAPHQARIVLVEVSDTGNILSQLQSFLLSVETLEKSRASLVQVEQVVATLTGCVSTISELEVLLDELKSGPMNILDRLKWAKKAPVMNEMVKRLQSHKLSLSLMLAIFNRCVYLDSYLNMC